ncbi:hypothetical protein ES703_89407 [subsurface metagenome]
MSRLRIILVASLVILGVLVVFTVFRPMVSGEKYSKVSRESVIQREDEWIIQYSIVNREGKDMNYIINWSAGGETYSERVLLKDGGIFTYIQHVYPETVKEGKAHLSIHKGGEATPFEESTYYIRFD